MSDRSGKITRKQFLSGAALTVLSAMLPGTVAARPRKKRPNILLVIADEWRAQAFGYAGDPNCHTPAIDAFAAQSLDFRNAVAGTPICCPARADLITGQYPLKHGVIINDVELKPNTVTLGEAFAASGYATGYIGKWHLHGSPQGRYERRYAMVPPDKRFGFQYWKAAECDHSYNRSHYFEGSDPTRKFWSGYDAIAQTDDAIAFIQQHSSSDAPYFLTLAWGPPHFPYVAPPEYRAKYDDKQIVLRPNVPASSESEALKELRGYYAQIHVLNDCFARLMEGLDATGTADDTIVIFMSDHGDMAYSQALHHKLYPWDESIRIPFLIRWPAKFGRRGRQLGAHLNMPDIMPTLLGLVGIAVPEGVEGVDYSPAMRGRKMRSAPESALISLPIPIGNARSYGFAEYRGVRTDRYTYVRSIDGPWLLYDNLRDPFQKHNLIATADKGLIGQLEAELQGWLDRTGDRFEPAAAYIERANVGHYIEVKESIGHVESPWGDWQSTLPAAR